MRTYVNSFLQLYILFLFRCYTKNNYLKEWSHDKLPKYIIVYLNSCCVQETRWRNANTKKIVGKDSIYKLFGIGNDKGTNGVGILLAEKWIDKVIDVNRLNDRIMIIKLIVGKSLVSVVSAYAPQCGLDDSSKDIFYDELLAVVLKLGEKESLRLETSTDMLES